MPDNKTEAATFIINISYRQNDTWQGKILWADKDKTQYFRSALEMMKLIDNALSEGVIMASQVECETSDHLNRAKMG